MQLYKVSRPQKYIIPFLTQLTLDASAVLEMEQIDKDTRGLLEPYTREYVLKIHSKRLTVLK